MLILDDIVIERRNTLEEPILWIQSAVADIFTAIHGSSCPKALGFPILTVYLS